MSFSNPVTLEPPRDSGGGLLANSGPLPIGWERGILFNSTQCVPPFVVGECPTGSGLKPLGNVSGPHEFRPVDIGTAIKCTTMSTEFNAASGSNESLDAVRDYALSRELLTGDISARDASPGYAGNPSLQSAVTANLGAAFPSVTALVACLEQRLADGLFGRQGTLHVSPGMLIYLTNSQLIYRDGARVRTAAGTLVISSAGYDGRSPAASGAPASGDPLWVYATGQVYAGTGFREVLTDVDRSINQQAARAEEHALAAFSPCLVLAGAATTATACAP